MQCTASPAVIPINIRNQMLARGPGPCHWHGRQFDVVNTPDRGLRVFELDCWDHRPQPVPYPCPPQPTPQPWPQPAPTPAPTPTPAPHAAINPWRIASFAAVGLGGLAALHAFMFDYWNPIMGAIPGVILAGVGAYGVMHTQKPGSHLFG